VALAGVRFDKSDVLEVTVESPVRSVALLVLDVEDIKVADAFVSDGLGIVTTVPFRNETFRVEVKVIVVVLSEVDVAEEL
jgi:hypothetical protein